MTESAATAKKAPAKKAPAKKAPAKKAPAKKAPSVSALARSRREEAIDQNSDRLGPHAPFDIEDRDLQRLARTVVDKASVNLIVLACDIRKSTFLMKEAVDFGDFANILSGFVSEASRVTRVRGGFFDKFTGDGFLAYWEYGGPSDLISEAEEPLFASRETVAFFNAVVGEDFRANSQNFPEGVGISIGLDAGPCYLAEVAGDITIVGPAVVGAVRMVNCAGPDEIIANVYIGEALKRASEEKGFAGPIRVGMEYRQTKEYMQQVFPVTFKDLDDRIAHYIDKDYEEPNDEVKVGR
jgi:class 3 adenylate cyclase